MCLKMCASPLRPVLKTLSKAELFIEGKGLAELCFSGIAFDCCRDLSTLLQVSKTPRKGAII